MASQALPPFVPRSRLRLWWSVAVLVVLVLGGVGGYLYREYGDEGGTPLPFDPARPFELVMTRGDSRGFLIHVMAADGTVRMYRPTDLAAVGPPATVYERATTRLTEEERQRLTDAIARDRLGHLRDEFSSGRGEDTEWYFSLRQNGQEKIVRCQGEFPRRLTQFVWLLDRIAEADDRGLQWKEVPPADEQFKQDWLLTRHDFPKRP